MPSPVKSDINDQFLPRLKKPNKRLRLCDIQDSLWGMHVENDILKSYCFDGVALGAL